MFRLFLPVIAIAILTACGASGKAAGEADIEAQNRMNISLLDQIRRLPGVALRNGVPVFTKSTSDITAGVAVEPLYVLNGYPVGNSFADLDQLVENVNIKRIEALTDSEASFYGSRGANGVIKITTRQ